jgi:hypothetical protein
MIDSKFISKIEFKGTKQVFARGEPTLDIKAFAVSAALHFA